MPTQESRQWKTRLASMIHWIDVLSQHQNWLDRRHHKTLAWIMVGLLLSGTISLPEWVPYVHSRAQYAQSTVRRFRSWLDNRRIKVHKLYGPLIQQALMDWVTMHRSYACEQDLSVNQGEH